ncbi:MAG: histidine kinase [Bacteroidales bacterium]|nr:histidine kinase [Bacteroidales bacterium]
MPKQNRLRPHQIAYLIDAVIIFLISLLALLDRDHLSNKYYFDWLNLIHYIPLYVTYAIVVCFYRGYKKRRSLARYLTGSMLCCVAVSVVWSLFFYNSLPVTQREKTYEQFRQNQIIFSENSTKKIARWVDEEHISSSQLIDSCKAYNAERRAVRQNERKTTQQYWRLLLFLISNLTIFATVTAVHFTFQMIETENERREAEKLKIEAEHKLLKYQLNPHFLMNTLNNIHAQIDIDSEAAQESVRLLSKLMRYILYEANHDRVPLAKEVDFLSNYFEMMRKRYIDTVSIELIVPKEIPNISIPPVLFINLAENAFKHGITYDSSSFLRFELKVENDKIICHSVNSKIKNKADIQESYGFGIESLRKRLDLIYADNYTYDIEDTENTYTVNLIIPIV